MRRTRLKKKSKSEIALIQEELWGLCKSITRLTYGNTCYTCGKGGLQGANWHTGHFIPKASIGAYLKYDLRVLRPQCYYCNINLGGNGAVFYDRLLKEKGKKYVDKIMKDRNVIVKAREHYIDLITKYKKINNKLIKLDKLNERENEE